MTREIGGGDHASFIEGAWYIIEVARRVGKRPVTVERFGTRIVLFRDAQGALVAARARCPHRGADLGLGRVVDGELECPYHGFRFAADGRCVAIPCEGRGARVPAGLELDRFEVREHRGFVWLWWGERPAELPPLPWFDALPPDERGAHDAIMVWDVPFARVMEGMLDIHHVPFAHRPWVPGVGARLDPYEVTTEGDLIRTEGVLRRDDGAPWDGKRGMKFLIEVHFPGLLHLSFSPRMSGVAGCAPIDEYRTWIVARYHVSVPVIGRLLARLSLGIELRLIQPDDERLLASSDPRALDLEACRFVRADAGILAWHKMRRARLRPKAAEPRPGLPGAAE